MVARYAFVFAFYVLIMSDKTSFRSITEHGSTD